MTDNFVAHSRFFDDKHYPRGFSRHGDFTIKEAQLLERYGQAFNSLHIGIRQPSTQDEHRFVEVCQGLREPVTDEERVWKKYIGKINRPKRIHTLSGGKPNIDGGTEDYPDI